MSWHLNILFCLIILDPDKNLCIFTSFRKEAENVVTCRLYRILMDFCRLKRGYQSERKTFVNGCNTLITEFVNQSKVVIPSLLWRCFEGNNFLTQNFYLTYLQKCRTVVFFQSFYTKLYESSGLLKFPRTIELLLLKA